MRSYLTSILTALAFSFMVGQGLAEELAPAAVARRLPNIKASLDDGFYSLAEQQARGVLRSDSDPEVEREAVLLLAHALWGQKRYSEMLDLLDTNEGGPGFAYWRARAYLDLRQFETAVQCLDAVELEMAGSDFAPAILRLKGFIERLNGRFQAAEDIFLRFAESFPDHPDGVDNLFNLAEIYVDQNKMADAIAVYESLAEEQALHTAQLARLKLAHLLYTREEVRNPDVARSLFFELATNANTRLAYRIDAFVDLAALEDQVGGRAAAATALKEAIALSPDARQRVPVKLSLARMRLREGNTQAALKLLEECRAEVPNETLAATLQLEKADALLQAGRFQEADEAYQVYLEVASDPPGLVRAYYGKGLALWDLGRFSESAAALDKAVKGPIDADRKADALFKAGDAYYRAGNYSDAEKRYRAFTADFPSHPDTANALYQHGLSLAKVDRRTEALAVFQTLEGEYPHSPFSEQAALRAADVMRAGEQWDAALDKYTVIEQTYTNSATAAASLCQRGLLLYRLGRVEEAYTTFEAVISSYPESRPVPQAIYMQGFCLYLMGEVDKAVQTCRTFIEQYPDSEWTPEVMFWLAEQYYNQGKYEEAEPLFMRIVEDVEKHRLVPRALYWAGRSAAAQAKYVIAIERYSAVARDFPDSELLPQTRFAQGDALSELGEFARAILAFDEIIKNHPESHLVSPAWGRKGDCQFSLAVEDPVRYGEAMSSYQAVLDRPLAPPALKLQAEYKLGRCLEKTNVPEQAFNRYMSVVYTFMNTGVEHSPYSIMWFTRSAFGAAAIKEREKAWSEVIKIYERVIEENVPAKDEALRRIEKIRRDNWLEVEKAAI